MIPVYQPSIANNQRKYVLDCLDTNWITFRGKYVNTFQDEFCKFTGSNYASVVSNGTVAIHVALEALGYNPKINLETGLEMVINETN